MHSVGEHTFFLACSSTYLSNHRPEEELDVFADGVKYSAKGQVGGERKKRRNCRTVENRVRKREWNGEKEEKKIGVEQ